MPQNYSSINMETKNALLISTLIIVAFTLLLVLLFVGYWLRTRKPHLFQNFRERHPAPEVNDNNALVNRVKKWQKDVEKSQVVEAQGVKFEMQSSPARSKAALEALTNCSTASWETLSTTMCSDANIAKEVKLTRPPPAVVVDKRSFDADDDGRPITPWR